MSTYPKRLPLYAKNVKEHTSNKPLYSGEFLPYLPEQVSQDLSLFQYSNALNVGMLTENLYQKNFNLLTDSYSGLHEYE